MPFEIPDEHPPQLRAAGLADRHVGGQRARGVPDDRSLPVRPGADLPAGRPAVHPLPEPRVDRRRAGQPRPRGRAGDGLHPAAGGRHPRGACWRTTPASSRRGTARSTPTSPASRSRPTPSYAPPPPRSTSAASGSTATSTATCSTPTTWRPWARSSSRTRTPSCKTAVGRPVTIDAELAGAAPRERAPAHPAARAGAGGGRDAGPRHPRRGVRRGAHPLGVDQPLDGLPHPRAARRARADPARAPERPGADVPLGPRARARPPGLPRAAAG